MAKKIIVVHDVDGRIYFKGIQNLKDLNKIESVDYYETSIFKKLAALVIKGRNDSRNISRIFKNLLFMLSVPRVNGTIVIIGIAPYSFSFLWYGLLGIRNKVIYHTSWPYWWGDNVPQRKAVIYKLSRWLFKLYFLKMNYEVVCVTEPVKISFDSELEKIDSKVIPHSVDLSSFNDISRGEFNVRNRVLFVGRLVKQKGVLEILKIANLLKNTHQFSIVGDGEEIDEMKKKSRGLDNIVFYGHLKNKDQLADLFKSHETLILPSKKISGWEELFGLVIIEAMACGLLVISTDHIGPRGIIRDNVNGFLVSEKEMVSNFVSKLREIQSENIDKEKIIENAKLTANSFSLKCVSEKWEEIICE